MSRPTKLLVASYFSKAVDPYNTGTGIDIIFVEIASLFLLDREHAIERKNETPHFWNSSMQCFGIRM